MAWFPIAAMVVSTVIQMAGASKAADAAKLAGERQQQAGQYQADQLNQRAGQEEAASQRSAIDERRQAAFASSRAVAVAGASGGGVSDVTVQNLVGDIQGEGAYRAAVKLYQGEENARQLRMGADAKIYEGGLAAENANQQAGAYMTKGFTSAISSMGQMGTSLYSKYGKGGPTGSMNSFDAQMGMGDFDAGLGVSGP